MFSQFGSLSTGMMLRSEVVSRDVLIASEMACAGD